MKTMRWQITMIVVLLLGLLTAGASTAQDSEPNFDTLLQDALDLVLAHHPTLVSQRSIVASNEDLDLSKRGLPLSLSVTGDVGTRVISNEVRFVPLVGLSVSLPLIDPNRTIDDEMKRRTAIRAVEGDIQELQTVQERIVTRFTEDVLSLISTKNSTAGRRELLQQLEERRIQLESLVRSGADPAGLWNLDERIANLRVELLNLQSQLDLGVNRTAMNFGGERWSQLREMLVELITASEVVGIHE